MREIAAVIATALGDDFESEKDALAERTAALMDRYPLYSNLTPADGLSLRSCQSLTRFPHVHQLASITI